MKKKALKLLALIGILCLVSSFGSCYNGSSSSKTSSNTSVEESSSERHEGGLDLD